MRAVVQRVRRAAVDIDGRTVSEIGPGLVVFLGVGPEDMVDDVIYLAEKIAYLRIFSDDEDKMNLSVSDLGGDILAVSQFTLFGDCRKGRRPSFSQAALPDAANELYEMFVEKLRLLGLTVRVGVFQAHMLVKLENDGPVTMLIDSKKQF